MTDNNGTTELRAIGIDARGRKWLETNVATNWEGANVERLYPSLDGKYLAVVTVYGEQTKLSILDLSSGRVWCPFDKPEWCIGGFSAWMRNNRFLFRAGMGGRPENVSLGMRHW
jgi:hypothetical protein